MCPCRSLAGLTCLALPTSPTGHDGTLAAALAARAPSSPGGISLAELHLGMLAREDLSVRDGGAKDLLEMPRKLLDRLPQVGEALRLDVLHDEDAVRGVVGDLGALAIAPVPAAADGTGVVHVA